MPYRWKTIAAALLTYHNGFIVHSPMHREFCGKCSSTLSLRIDISPRRRMQTAPAPLQSLIHFLRHAHQSIVAVVGGSPTQFATRAAQPSGSRLVVLDAVKIIAMVMMMQGHTLDALVHPAQLDITSYPWNIWHLLRGFTAPVFLTVSGMLFALTLKRGSDGRIPDSLAIKRIRWAGMLLLVGCLLVFPASSIYHLPWVSAEGWRMFFQVNILHLNAVALASVTVLALATRSARSFGWWSFGIGVTISMLTPFVNSMPWFYIVPEFVGTFFSYQHGSIFPLFPYSSYMFIGAAAGVVLNTVPKDERFTYIRRMSWRVAIISSIVGGILALVIPTLGFVPQLDFLQSSPACVWLRVGAVSAFVFVVSAAFPLMRCFEHLLALFGRQSLVVYVVHLIILYGTPWFPSVGRFYPKTASLDFGLMMAVVVVGGTLLIVYAEDLLARNAGRVLRFARLSLGAMLAYALLL